jgi:hypothetical protein
MPRSRLSATSGRASEQEVTELQENSPKSPGRRGMDGRFRLFRVSPFPFQFQGADWLALPVGVVLDQGVG